MNAHIYVIGPGTIQNRMLVKYIADQTGVMSECRRDYGQGEPLPAGENKPLLLLWDCLSNNLARFWALCSQRAGRASGPSMALINAPREQDLEMQALRNGADGLFRESESLDHLTAGIGALLRGDLWYSRDVLARFVREERKVRPEPRQLSNASCLTARERQVLEYIAAGASNEEIAKRLFISPSTVKTHAYNIYAKIRVPNRIQAALWAVQNL